MAFTVSIPSRSSDPPSVFDGDEVVGVLSLGGFDAGTTGETRWWKKE
jgi:hypothetical protein